MANNEFEVDVKCGNKKLKNLVLNQVAVGIETDKRSKFGVSLERYKTGFKIIGNRDTDRIPMIMLGAKKDLHTEVLDNIEYTYNITIRKATKAYLNSILELIYDQIKAVDDFENNEIIITTNSDENSINIFFSHETDFYPMIILLNKEHVVRCI